MVLRQLQDIKRRKFDTDDEFVDFIAKARFLQCCCDTSLQRIDFKVGELYGFGSCPLEDEKTIRPMVWVCISKEPGKALLLSKYGLSAPLPQPLDTSDDTEWWFSELDKQVGSENHSWSFRKYDREWIIELPFLLNESTTRRLTLSTETQSAAECRPTKHALRNGVSANRDGTCNWWVKAHPAHHPPTVVFPFDEAELTQRRSNDFPATRPAVWVKNHAVQADEPPFYHGDGFNTFAHILDLINLSDSTIVDLRQLLPEPIVSRPNFVKCEISQGVYESQWADDKPNGIGWRLDSQGNQYLGNWLEGHRAGEGTAMYPDGSIYVGQWADDYYSEPGTFFSATDGRAYKLDRDGFVNGDRWFNIDNADA